MITVASFRVDFPEFANTTDYPSSLINYYLALSALLLNKCRWGQPGATVTNPPTSLYDMGQEMFVAHHVVLEARAQRAARDGAVPGQASGPVSSKSTGPISISYSTGDSVELDAGHWNDSEYGKRFIHLARMLGAGGLQLGVGGYGVTPMFNGVPLNGPAWPGPIYITLGPIN